MNPVPRVETRGFETLPLQGIKENKRENQGLLYLRAAGINVRLTGVFVQGSGQVAPAADRAVRSLLSLIAPIHDKVGR